MKSILGGLILAASLCAQVSSETEIQNNLASTLATIGGSRDAARVNRLTDQLMAVAEKGHPASRPAVSQFSRDLVASLSGRTLPRVTAVQLAAEIVVVMRSAGVATYKHQEAVERFAKGLSGLGVKGPAALSLATSLMLIGMGVRGPEDIHAIASVGEIYK